MHGGFMSDLLPTRPNLEHLREQAKDLLAAFRQEETWAIQASVDFLPAYAGMSLDEAGQSKLNLADAQSIIARQHGYASWPRLVKFVEALRNLEGTWKFTSLQVNGSDLPEGLFRNSSLTIDGNAFRMNSPEANYLGTCHIDVQVLPHTIDIHFTEGPEAGNSSFGIFEFDGRELKICLGFTGIPRPNEFLTTPGSGTALETLRRGGFEAEPAPSAAERPMDAPETSLEGFGEMTPELEKLQGRWKPQSITRNGMVLPKQFIDVGLREMTGPETTVTFGGQIWLQAVTRINPLSSPMEVDYLHSQGPTNGQIQLGIFEWRKEFATFCFAEPGMARPTDFTSTPGSERTLSIWKLAGSG